MLDRLEGLAAAVADPEALCQRLDSGPVPGAEASGTTAASPEECDQLGHLLVLLQPVRHVPAPVRLARLASRRSRPESVVTTVVE